MEDKTCEFNIKSKCYVVICQAQEKLLKWKPKTESKPVERSVQMRHIVMAAKGNTDTEWVVTFAERKKKDLVVQNVTFSHQDSTVCQEWITIINEAIQHVEGQKRPKKILVFINPQSGRHRGVQIYDKQIKPLFALAGVQTDVIVTEDANDAAKVLAEYNLSSLDGIASAGGDGTLMQVVNGLQQRVMKEAGKDVDVIDEALATTDLRIGVLATGTGQGMLETFTGSKDVVTSALTIILGEELPMDLMTVHSGGKLMAYSTLMACTGLFGDTANDAESRRSLGPVRYLVSMIRNLATFRKIDSEIHFLEEDQGTGDEEGAASQNWKIVKGRALGAMCALLDIVKWMEGELGPGRPNAYIRDKGIFILILDGEMTRGQFLKLIGSAARGKGQAIKKKKVPTATLR